MTAALTPRQGDALEAIRAHIVEHGYAPTVRELADRLGVTSTNAASELLRGLEQRGAIRRAAGKSRAIVVTEVS